jgi:hypothetical protein
MLVQRSLDAARKIEAQLGVSIEVIDLRTLSPFDWAAVEKSVTKTARAMVHNLASKLRRLLDEEKDLLETWVCKSLCRGDLTLEAAQATFLEPDWRRRYLQWVQVE